MTLTQELSGIDQSFITVLLSLGTDSLKKLDTALCDITPGSPRNTEKANAWTEGEYRARGYITGMIAEELKAREGRQTNLFER